MVSILSKKLKTILQYTICVVILVLHFVINREIQRAFFDNMIWYYETTRNWKGIIHSIPLCIVDCIISFVSSKLLRSKIHLAIAQLADTFMAIIVTFLLIFVFFKDTVLMLCFDNTSLQNLAMLSVECLLLKVRFHYSGRSIRSIILDLIKRIKQ